MKTAIILLAILSFSVTTFSQKPTTDRYDRSAMTLYLLDYNANKYHDKTLEAWNVVKLHDKFDNNELSSRILTCRNKLNNNSGHDEKLKAIKEKIDSEKIANQIIAKWFDRQPDGTMGVRLIHERGLYTAQDQDILTAAKSKRGIDVVKDMGMALVNKSYIHVVDFADIKHHTDLKLDPVKQQRGWQTKINSYLFKIVFDEGTMNELFEDMWIYEDDSPETAKTKIEKFNNYTFKVEFVALVSDESVSAMQYGPEHPLGKYVVQKSDDELFHELLQKGYDHTIFLFEKKVPDLRVKVNVFEIKPIRAKVGKKEALKQDQRFFVHEYVYNEKTQQPEPKRKAVVRAKKVVDNRQIATGQSPTSTFYQIHGRKVEPGMLLEQRNDRGIGIQPRFHIGEMGGMGLKIALNPNPMLNLYPISQVKVFGALAMENKTYGVTDFSFTRLSYGVSKGWYFANAFNLELSAAYGAEVAKWDSSDDVIKVGLLVLGSELGLHLTHWLRGFAGFDFHIPVTKALDKDGNEFVLSPAYTDFFENRTGLTLNLGISIEF